MDPFAALGDPVRRDLVLRLARGPARVVDLAAGQSISRPAVSRHLRLLAESGLVDVDDRGRERHYRLRSAGLEPVAELLEALLGARAPAPPVAERLFDGLELEVRRTGRERRATEADTSTDDRTDHPTPLQEDTA